MFGLGAGNQKKLAAPAFFICFSGKIQVFRLTETGCFLSKDRGLLLGPLLAELF